MSLRTPLARVKGLGSAKEGVSHWWSQKLTSLALVPLVIWLCFSLASIGDMNHAAFVGWVASPMNTVLLSLTLAVGFHHTYLGLQVVIEDYIHGEAMKTTALIAVGFACALFGVVGVFAVLRIAFGA